MSVQPIKIYGHALGPNPWKVNIICEELGIPYSTEFMDFGDLKKEPFLTKSPNGRTPVIEDPNTGITLWESGAIVDYLIDTYDKEQKLHFISKPEKYYQQQWEHFQMSGQGPYFGQKAWFTHFHPGDKIHGAIERYGNEIRRVLGVIDLHLSKTGQEYLVGPKVTYADLMFVPWNSMLGFVVGPEFDAEWKKDYPKSYEWNQKLISRPAVKKVMAEKEKKVAEGQK